MLHTWTRRGALALGFITSIAVLAPGAARAQDEFDPDYSEAGDAEPEPTTVTEGTSQRAQWGVGVRLRNVRIPQGLIELFVERASSGVSSFGFGIEAVRRKANFEMAVGLEYENLSPDDGVWIDKGDSIPQDDPDFVRFDGLGWVGLDVSFIWQQPVHEMVAIRYGAGIGLGLVTGDVYRTDYRCTSMEVSSCGPLGGAVEMAEDDIPPVFPIINFIVGAQIRPTENISINIEGGLRTFPYLGVTGGYFF